MPWDADCLIVVDLQRGFVEGSHATPQAPAILPSIRAQLSAAREAGALVVQVQNDGPVGAVDEPDTWGWQLHFPPTTHDVVARKREDSGFVGTDLHRTLQQNGVTAISVCGVMSEMCVAATARDALRLGYDVILAHDSHGTYPVPAFGPGEVEVTAEQAARAAEWSLGDRIRIPAGGRDVHFSPPAGDRRSNRTDA